MARVPTWTELRLNAEKLIAFQNQFDEKLYNLLHSLPKLDKKILSLDASRNIDTTLMWPIQQQPINKKINPTKKKDIDFNKFPHLRPLDRPLSEYLKINRPEVFLRAHSRVSYLKKRSEKRKFLASSKIINRLEQIRISSRTSSGNRQSNGVNNNYNNNNYNSNNNNNNYNNNRDNYGALTKLTEHEMKRLTARIYNRLPEVKKKRKEEVTNHLKVQNYKNKLEYGRKLLENRRHGIINYPLRLSYDDRSIDTDLDSITTTNGNNYMIGSADVSSSIDPYCY